MNHMYRVFDSSGWQVPTPGDVHIALVVVGAIEHVPPPAHPTADAGKVTDTATPCVFCATNSYDVAPLDALHEIIGV